MKTTIMLDTLAYANQLKAAGVPAHIAEAHATANAKMLEGLIDTQLATKRDLAELENKLEHRIDDLKFEVKQDINHLEKDMHSRLKDLELRLTVRMGIVMSGVLGIYTAVAASFLHLSH